MVYIFRKFFKIDFRQIETRNTLKILSKYILWLYGVEKYNIVSK